MNIQVFKPFYRVNEILTEIKECLDRGWTGMGFKTLTIEEEWKKYTGLKNAHFLNSATSGLHLALNILKREYNWQDNDEVISSPLTFVSTNHAIIYERMHPVFADVDETLCLDPADIEKKITKKTRAMIYVLMGGNTGKLDEVSELCRKHKIKLILDCAHAAGTTYHSKHIGGEGDVSVFSYQAVKNMPTADSGMICFNDGKLDKLARELSWLGIDKDTYARTNKGDYKWKYDVPNVGFKYHGNSIMASMALVALKYLDQDNEYRRKIASWYHEALKNHHDIKTIPISEYCVSSTHFFPVVVENRDDLMDKLYSNGICPGVHYNINTDYTPYKYAKNTCKNAEFYSKSLISLPVHLHLRKKDIFLIINAISNSMS